MNLSQLLSEARKRKGMTQEELADASGVTVRTIQRIESGDTVPRAYTLKALAEALGTTYESLLPVPEVEPVPAVPTLIAPVTPDDPDAVRHFLQLHALSCFSFLVLPLVHFLVPMALLRRRGDLVLPALRFGRATVRGQVYWAIAFNCSLLLLAGWNSLRAARFGGTGVLAYGWPIAVFYGLNAVLIAVRVARVRRALLADARS